MHWDAIPKSPWPPLAGGGRVPEPQGPQAGVLGVPHPYGGARHAT